MRFVFRVIRLFQPRRHTMGTTSRQPELLLSGVMLEELIPEERIGECRELVGQMLREVMRAEKELADEE